MTFDWLVLKPKSTEQISSDMAVMLEAARTTDELICSNAAVLLTTVPTVTMFSTWSMALRKTATRKYN